VRPIACLQAHARRPSCHCKPHINDARSDLTHARPRPASRSSVSRVGPFAQRAYVVHANARHGGYPYCVKPIGDLGQPYVRAGFVHVRMCDALGPCVCGSALDTEQDHVQMLCVACACVIAQHSRSHAATKLAHCQAHRSEATRRPFLLPVSIRRPTSPARSRALARFRAAAPASERGKSPRPVLRYRAARTKQVDRPGLLRHCSPARTAG
jgi:hypothetical protein